MRIFCDFFSAVLIVFEQFFNAFVIEIAAENIELDINVFIDGLLCEYVKYCRGFTANTPDKLYKYTKYWLKNFKERLYGEPL